MSNSNQGLVGNKYKPLSRQDVEKIHNKSVDLLAEMGVKTDSKNVMDFFSSQGAEVDFDKGIIKISSELLEECINNTPQQVELYRRDDNPPIVLGDERVYFGSGGAATQVLDPETGDARPAVTQDLANIARLVDTLDNFHFFVRPVTLTDADKDTIDMKTFFTALDNTYKHVSGTLYTVEGAENVIEMARMIQGGSQQLKERPIVSFILEMLSSPLVVDGEVFDIIKVVAENEVPLIPASAPICGSTAPLTLAGTIVQVHAEALFGIVATQLINPGTPVIYGAVPFTSDLKTMGCLGGSIETGMLNASAAQMAQFVDVPNYVGACVSDSKIPDQQAGIEKTQGLLQAVLAGGNYIHHGGMLESLLTVSYEQYVIDNDIAEMALRCLQGLEVNEDTMAYEVIKSVGQGGQFISQPHTVRYGRSSEHFTPAVLDRSNREIWQSKGAKDTRERAQSIVERILDEHHPQPIVPEEEKEIKDKFNL